MNDLSYCTLRLQTSIVYSAPLPQLLLWKITDINREPLISSTNPWSGTNPWSRAKPWPRTFPTRSIVSQYMDVYVSQLEIHILQKAGSESMKTRPCISDIDSRWKVGTFEVFVEVYQITLLGVSTNPPRRVSWYVWKTFFGRLTNVLISDPVYPPYIRNVYKGWCII